MTLLGAGIAITPGQHDTRFIELASDVTHTQSDTDLEDVTGMSFTVENGGTYVWTLWLHQNSSGIADMDIGYSSPAGTGRHIRNDATASATALGGKIEAPGTGSDAITIFHGFFQPTADGTVQLRFAQGTSEASDTKVLDGTSIIVHRTT